MREFKFWYELRDMYEEYLNDIYEMIDVCGIKFEAGRVLREMDSIAFNEGLTNWMDLDEWVEVWARDMTEDEREYCQVGDNQVMYWCRGL